MGEIIAPDPVAEIIGDARRSCELGRPLVTLTYAQSLDGSISARADAPLAISCEETKLLTHRLRAAHDAILVGIGTVLADNPKLTARRVGGPHPIPVVLDSYLRTPETARVLKHPQGCIIAASENANKKRETILRKQGAQVVRFPQVEEGISLPSLLNWLCETGIRSLMVEGGRQVLTSFLKYTLVDWVLLTIAPYFIGGVHAIDALPPLRHPVNSVESFPGLGAEWQAARFGRDLVLWGKINSQG